MQVAPSVYFYPFTSINENNCNSILIDGQEKVLIDPGHKHLWPELKRSIENDGIKTDDISLVIHTHCHPDHMAAGELLEFENHATQAMSEEEYNFLQSQGMGFFAWMGLNNPKGSIGRLLKEGPLELPDKTLDLYLAPGHTPGSLCIHWPEAKVLITGDVIFAHSVGRTDFPGGSTSQLDNSIEKLAALQNVDILLPGHGPAVIGAKRVEENFKYVRQFF